MGCSNKATFESQRGYVVLLVLSTLPHIHPSVITDLVKQIGRQLLAGKLNLINVSLPVKIFEPRSYLEKLADVWVYPQYVLVLSTAVMPAMPTGILIPVCRCHNATMCRYLKAAAETSNPIERMKLVISFFIAGVCR